MSVVRDVASAARGLADGFSGQIVLPGDASYEADRRVHNGSIDKRPAVIARCAGTADVAAAVAFGREQGLDISVRGGGHNVAGRAVVEGGLMIDLAPIDGVHVDPVARTAVAGGGSRWKPYNRETQLYGLASPGGVIGTTGVAGLTLGGGFGWLTPKLGMAMDNLVAADIVLADGRALRTSAEQEPDLFWAIRGGGGNFGVVTHFTFRLHPVGPTVMGGLIAWPFSEAGRVLRFFRDFTADLPDDIMAIAGLVTAPDGATRLAAMVVGHCGSVEDGEAAVAPLKAFGQPVLDAIGPMSYEALNGILDDAAPRGARNYWKTHFLSELSDGAIEALIARFQTSPHPMTQILIEHFHGANTRVPIDATAFTMRAPGFNSLVLGQWTDPKDDEAGIAWTRGTYAALEPYVSDRRYVNYLGEEEMATSVLEAAYGPNLPRLRALKRQFDPDNLFHENLNIPPA